MSLRFARLDRASVRALKAREKIIEHGIAVERLDSGDLRWTVNVMVDGARIHRVIGKESAGVTRTTCEQFIERARSDARAGRLSLPKGRKLSRSLGVAADEYLERLERSGGKNLARKRMHLRDHLKPRLGSIRLNLITTETLGEYAKSRLEAGAANGTVNRELATLSHLFSKAVEWRWLDRLPCRPKMLDEGQGRIIALTDEESDALMRASIASADPYCWLFVAFGLNTAMRHSEILAARFDQVDLEKRRLFIPEAKAGQREQPITPELAEILRKERETRDDQDGWVFPSPHKDSGTGHRARMDFPFRDAVTAAGLDPHRVTPHVMRHTAITALVKAGVDLPTIQRISGHKTLEMVMRYSHVHAPHIDRAMGAIGRALPELPENEPPRTITQKLHGRRLRVVK